MRFPYALPNSTNFSQLDLREKRKSQMATDEHRFDLRNPILLRMNRLAFAVHFHPCPFVFIRGINPNSEVEKAQCVLSVRGTRLRPAFRSGNRNADFSRQKRANTQRVEITRSYTGAAIFCRLKPAFRTAGCAQIRARACSKSTGLEFNSSM